MPNGNLLAYGRNIVGGYSSNGGGSGGGGHVIQDSAGNNMPHQDILQVSGYNQVTNDATNGKTIINDAPTSVTWTVWQTMTSEQKAGKKWLITDVPGAESEVEIETMYLAWTNPNPTQKFTGQTITIDTSACPDYEKVRVEFTLTTGGVYKSVDVPKNQSSLIDFAWKDTGSSPNQAGNLSRVFTISNGNTITFENASFTEYNSLTTQNNLCIPQRIYIYKSTFIAKITSIASDVSTLASNCMMSDEQTSVEDAIGNVNGWTLAGNVTSTSLVTVTVPATAKEILAVLLNPSNVVLISQVIPRELMSSGASLKDVANTSKELYSNGSKWKVTDATYTGKIYYRN